LRQGWLWLAVAVVRRYGGDARPHIIRGHRVVAGWVRPGTGSGPGVGVPGAGAGGQEECDEQGWRSVASQAPAAIRISPAAARR